MPRAPSLPPRPLCAGRVAPRDLTPGRRGLLAYVPARTCGAASPRGLTAHAPEPELDRPSLAHASHPCRAYCSTRRGLLVGALRAEYGASCRRHGASAAGAVAARWRLRDVAMIREREHGDAMVRVADAAAVMAIAVLVMGSLCAGGKGATQPHRSSEWLRAGRYALFCVCCVLRARVYVNLSCRAHARGRSRRVCRVLAAGLPFSCASCARANVPQGVRVAIG